MANDSISGLKAELEAALAVLDPEIRGVSDVSGHPITDGLRVQLGTAQTSMEHRRDLIQQGLDDINKLLADMATLENDGYPTPQTFELNDVLLGELNGEVIEVQAGSSVFHGPLAARLNVTLSNPVPKPQGAAE